MSLVTELVTLQAYDDEAAALRAALSDVEHRLRGDAELDEARRLLLAAEQTKSAVAREQRKLEDEIETLTGRIEPEEKRLYDGSVRAPKELQNIQHELELLTASRTKLEDALVDVLDRAESAERERLSAARQAADLEARWERHSEDLRTEARRLTTAVARAEARREAQKEKVQPRALQTYENLRQRKGGAAVARIKSGICGGCRIGIPDAVRTRAIHGAVLAQCPSCERILYVG